MPVYEYRCRSCGHQFDVQQAFSDDALTVCPECAGDLRKVFAPVGIAFKGSGFYKTDSRPGSSSGSGSGSSGGDSTGATNGSSGGTGDKGPSSGSGGSGSGDSDSGSAGTGSGTSGSGTTSTPSTSGSD